jgi:hypothetical protein
MLLIFMIRIPSSIRIGSGIQKLIRVGYTYRHTDWWEGFKKYAVEMGSGVMKNIRNFIKTGSGVQKIIRDGYTDTQTDGGIYEVRRWDKLRCHDITLTHSLMELSPS